jgi:trimeric autotransporter adhesin
VALTAAITASPSGAQYVPTVSFGATTPATISGTSAATATLTIATTAARSSALEYPAGPGARWYGRAGVSLALVLLFWIPKRRRGLRAMLGMVALGVVLAAGMTACGGGSSAGTSGGGGGIAGTTAGSYTITVTGTSGSISQTGTVTLTVQ